MATNCPGLTSRLTATESVIKGTKGKGGGNALKATKDADMRPSRVPEVHVCQTAVRQNIHLLERNRETDP